MLFSFFQGCFSWLNLFLRCWLWCWWNADGISALKEQHAISTASTWTNAVPIMFQFVALSTFEGDCMMFASLMMYIVLCLHPRTEVQNRSPCTNPPNSKGFLPSQYSCAKCFHLTTYLRSVWTSYVTYKPGITNSSTISISRSPGERRRKLQPLALIERRVRSPWT